MRILFLVVLIFTLNTALFSGIIREVKGEVMIDNGEGWIPAVKGDTVKDGVDIMTGFDSSIKVEFETGEFTLNELSQMKYVEKATDKKIDSTLNLSVGKVRVKYEKLKSQKESSFKVQTPKGSASVRGTEEEVGYTPDQGMRVEVISGHVDVASRAGIQVAVTKGREVRVPKSGATIKTMVEKVDSQVKGETQKIEKLKEQINVVEVVQQINQIVTVEIINKPIEVIIPEIITIQGPERL